MSPTSVLINERQEMFSSVSTSMFTLFGTVSSWSLMKFVPLFEESLGSEAELIRSKSYTVDREGNSHVITNSESASSHADFDTPGCQWIKDANASTALCGLLHLFGLGVARGDDRLPEAANVAHLLWLYNLFVQVSSVKT